MKDKNLTEILTRIERELIIISISLCLLIGEKIKQTLEEGLDDTDRKIQVYQLTDDTRSRREIAKIIGISHNTVQGWWNQWFLGVF